MRRRVAVASLAVGIVVTPVAAVGAGATTRSHRAVATTVKPDWGFYEGKTVTWITSAVGSTTNKAAVLVAPVLGSILHATVNVLAVPGANSASFNQIASSTPDGLTVGWASPNTELLYILDNPGTLTFSIRKTTIIGAFVPFNQILMSCAGSPYQSINSLMHASAQVTDVDNPQQPAILPEYLFLQAYHVPTKFITGYTGTTQPVGCERGDGQVAATATALFSNATNTALVPGLSPLLFLGPHEPKGSTMAWLDSSVMTMTEYIAKHPGKTAAARRELALANELALQGLVSLVFGPDGIPKARALALTDAFTQTMKNATVRAGLLNLGGGPGFQSPAKTQAAIDYIVKHQPQAEAYLSRPTS